MHLLMQVLRQQTHRIRALGRVQGEYGVTMGPGPFLDADLISHHVPVQGIGSRQGPQGIARDGLGLRAMTQSDH